MFLGIYPFCPVYWHTVVHNIFLQSFVFFLVSIVISPLLFLILFIWVPSLFFLMNLVKVLSIFFIFSKNQLLDSLIFYIISFRLYFIYFCSNLCISFLLLTLGFVCCSFSNSFKYKVRLFTWAFSFLFFFFFEIGL